MAFYPKYQLNNELTGKLLEIERHTEALSVLPITANLIASLRETARLLSTHYSTQIEGNELSKAEVMEVAEGKKGGFPGRERDEREVRNYFRALEYIESALAKGSKLTDSLIKTVHSLVLTGGKRKTPYRDGQNVIKDGRTGRIVYMPPEAKDVSILMKELVDWLNTEMEKRVIPGPIIAGLAHYQFATIHPYYDGNGRTARLLTTFILHIMGYGMNGIYSLEEYYAKNLRGYYEALNIGGSHNYYEGRVEADVRPFLDYFLSGMAAAFKRVRRQAEQSKVRVQDQEDYSIKLRALTPQQRQVLSLFQSCKEARAGNVAEHLGIGHRSAHSLINKWVKNGFLQIINPSRKARSYGLTPEWEQIVVQRSVGRPHYFDE
jgi:Fic family protein